MSESPLSSKIQNGVSISPPPRSLDDVRASSLSIVAAPPSVYSESKSVHITMFIVDATEYYRIMA